MTRKYKCINYNRIMEVCDIHLEDCDRCKLYQPVVVDQEELSEEILRSQGSMRCWEGDDEQ